MPNDNSPIDVQIDAQEDFLIINICADYDRCFQWLTLQDDDIVGKSKWIHFLKHQIMKEMKDRPIKQVIIKLFSYSNRTDIGLDTANAITRYHYGEPKKLWLIYGLLKLLTQLTNEFADTRDEYGEPIVKVCLNGFQFSDLTELVQTHQDNPNQNVSQNTVEEAILNKSGNYLYSVLKNVYAETRSEEIVKELQNLENSPYTFGSFVYVDPNNQEQMNTLTDILPLSLLQTLSGHIFFHQKKFYVITPKSYVLQDSKEIVKPQLYSDRRKLATAIVLILRQ